MKTGKIKDLVLLLNTFVEKLKSEKSANKSRLSRVYVRLVIISIIQGESYMSKRFIDEMFEIFNSYTLDDAKECRELVSAFENKDEQALNKLLQNSFYIYENDLLLALRNKFNEMPEAKDDTEDGW